MNRISKLLLILLACFTCEADTVGYSSSITGSRFIEVINEAIEDGLIDMESFSSWSDLEVLPPESQSRSLNGIVDLPNLSDYYFLIPKSERFETEHGVAYFALAEPFNYTEIAARIRARDEGKSLDEVDYSKVDRSEDFRWIIYLNEDGYLHKKKYREANFQELIEKHSLKVGKPEAYRVNMERLNEQVNEQQELVVSSVEEVVEVGKETMKPEKAPKEPAKVATAESPTEAAEKSSQLWLWLIGAVVVIGSLGLVLRRKS